MKRERSQSVSRFLLNEPDVTIVDSHGDKRKMHTQALSEASEFFRAAFSEESGWREREQKELTIGFEDPHHVFPDVIDFIYSGPSVTSVEISTACPLYILADQLQVTKLMEHIVSELQEDILPFRTIPLFHEGLKHNCVPILELCLEHFVPSDVLTCLEDHALWEDEDDLSHFSWLVDRAYLNSAQLVRASKLKLLSGHALASSSLHPWTFLAEQQIDLDDADFVDNHLFTSNSICFSNERYSEDVDLAKGILQQILDEWVSPTKFIHTVKFAESFSFDLHEFLRTLVKQNPNLRGVDFSTHYFTHETLKFLAERCKNLWHLSFDKFSLARFAGGVDEKSTITSVIEQFTKLENLHSVSLKSQSCLALFGLACHKSLTSIRVEIAMNILSFCLVFCGQLSTCPNLKTLDVTALPFHHENIQSLQPPTVQPLESLSSFNLHGNSSLLSFFSCPNLKKAVLKLEGDPKGLIPFLKTVPNLRELHALPASSLSSWPALPFLKTLKVQLYDQAPFDPDFFIRMPSLEDLHFECDFEDPTTSRVIPQHEGLKSLSGLYGADEQLCAEIVCAFPNLCHLDISLQQECDVMKCVTAIGNSALKMEHLRLSVDGSLDSAVMAMCCRAKRLFPHITVLEIV